MHTLERIHNWAKLAPNRIAYCGAGRSLSYAALWDGAERLAGALSGKSADRVILYGEKEPELLMAMLGCLLAGKTYVPVSDDTPRERFAQLLCSTQPCLVWFADARPPVGDAVGISSLLFARSYPLSCEQEHVQPAYLIFTSGSTGKPKGVPISRQNLDHFSSWICCLEPMRLQAPARVLNQASFQFDLSVADIYYSLCSGHTLFGLPKCAFSDPARIYAFLQSNDIEAAVCTPTFLKLCLLEPTFREQMLPSLRLIYSCGETLEVGTAARLLERFPGLRLINAYGPTEATSAVCAVEITKDMLTDASGLPVGRLSDAACRIEISHEEIILKGKSVFSGYLNADDRGIDSENGVSCFHTGDLGLIAGDLLYCKGRRDRQIKWKGYRIELDEIEQAILSVPGVSNCAVITRRTETGVVRLIKAFVVMETDLTVEALRQKISEKLPQYMIPKSIERIDAIPVTGNGKTDRRRLETQ